MSAPETTLHGLATTSLLVSLLIAIFLPLRPLLRRVIGSQWLCVLWLALLMRLLMPWPLESRWSVFNRWQNDSAPAIAAATAEPLKIKVSFPEDTGTKDAHTAIPASASPAVASPAMGSHWDFPTIANMAWLVGAALSLGMLALRWVQTRRLAAKTRPATDGRLQNLFDSIPRELRRGTQLRMTDALPAPTLAGILRPQIWMPLAWPAQFTDEELRNVLLHELGHARRRDLLVQWVFAIAQCIHWFNPLVWLAARAARFDREMACDAWVLARNNADHSGYGAALMKTIQLLRSPLHIAPATVAMASSRRSLHTRISGIGAFRNTPAWRGVAGVAVMIAALAAATTSRTPAQDATPAAQPVPPTPAAQPSATPAADAAAGNDSALQIELESKFIQLSEEEWKKLCAENPAFKDFNSKFPELEHAKPAYADLKDKLKQVEKGAWEFPNTEIIPLSLFSNEEFGKIVKSLNQEKDVDLLSAPSVTTKDSQRAAIEVVVEFRYPTEFQEDKNPKPGALKFTPTAFATKNLGATLEVKPKLNKDGTIELDLTPTLASLLGFLSEKDGVKTLTLKYPSGELNLKQPVFSTSTGNITETVHSGQTILLGGVHLDHANKDIGSSHDILAPEHAGAVPETARPILLVFVTARTVKPHSPAPGSTAQPSPAQAADSSLPYGIPVAGKEGYVTSPYDPKAGNIDVRGYPANTQVKDPYTGKIFLVP